LAGPVEAEFAAMYPVFSKAKCPSGWKKDVVHYIPEINPDHAELVKFSRDFGVGKALFRLTQL